MPPENSDCEQQEQRTGTETETNEQGKHCAAELHMPQMLMSRPQSNNKHNDMQPYLCERALMRMR